MTRNPAPRSLTPALALAALALAVLALPATAQNLDFGTVDLGEIDSQCFGVCFTPQGGGTSCDGSGVIDALAADPPFAIRGLRVADANAACTAGGSNVPVTLPVNLPAGKVLSVDVDMVATQLGAATGSIYINGDPGLSAAVNVLPPPPCSPSSGALCLNDDRFAVRTLWRTPFGGHGPGQVVPGVSSDDSGLFYFFNPNNWEILIKVLNGCGTNDHYWVFSAATTNVEYTITVTDTEDQKVSTYFNPLGHPAQPILDTAAFATCP